MSVNHCPEIKVHRKVGVRHDHVFFLLVSQILKNSRKSLHASHIGLGFFLRKGRENGKAAVFTHQIPLASGIQMIHQRVIVVINHHRYIIDIAMRHAG